MQINKRCSIILCIIPTIYFCVFFCTVSIAQQKKSTEKPATIFASAEDSKIFTAVQRATFQYFWDGAEPVSGLARERYHNDDAYPQNDKNIVTSGGGGFGVMAILVGIERKFITREEGRKRLEKIVTFLETADRFHGVWPHWWNGETGKVKPFSKYDDGGDLVESSFMLQGLLCVRQYFKDGNTKEKALATRIDQLWKEVDFNWYRNGKNVLYWHWSPNHEWRMNFPVRGYNECQIMYILAASSPTHGVPAEVYHEGWAQNGAINKNPSGYKDIQLQMHHQGDATESGPLFRAHYSYLGLDPRGLKDRYADYGKENTQHALIHYRWCVDNPKQYKGYGPNSWGLTSSYSIKGYAGHAPGMKRDIGVISPTAALSSFPYTPKESMAAMKNWYLNKKDQLWGPFGFYDAFSETENWYLPRYLAIDQGPIVVMMENYRSGLLWKLFMSCPEIQTGLKKLGFTSPYLK
ncbi:MAG: beta-glucosidase [Chitinophagaceae bacterium]|nr:beta-glucosidase [Chitinophagaceae bacterium]